MNTMKVRSRAVPFLRGARPVLASIFLVACCTVTSVQAQLFGDNEARKAILDLRTKVTELERQVNEHNSAITSRLEPTQRGQLELANQIEQLKTQLSQLRGQLDQLTNELATQQKRSRDLYTDLDARLKKLEPTSVTLDGQTVNVDRNEQSNYDSALALFRAGDFRAAVGALQSFIARYPASAYAALAQYWLGNSYYQLKDYKAAVTAQRVVVEKHPDSPRAPDALLNIAASQIELNDRNGARATLNRVIKDYPNSEAVTPARERLKSLGK